MEWLNYHHLLYFWMVAKHGSITRASTELRLAHPTISGQIHRLEDVLGEKLFARSGRNLVLTDSGRIAFRYADEIFALGRELMDTVKDRSTGQPLRLQVGVVDVVPKLVVRRLLQPALELELPVRLVCHEATYDKLLSELALHALDVVIADAPVPAGSQIRAFNHLLGETGVSFFGTRALAEAHGRDFPRSLDGAPMLLPLASSSLRRALDAWLERGGIRPRVVAEFEDSALSKVFGADGVGIFVAPTAVEDEVARQYGVQVIGRTEQVRERFYAVSAQRRLEHPAVVAISEAARHELFARERAGA